MCCIIIETNFVLEWWHVTKIDPLLFGVHWPPVVLLFWWHQQKTEECTSIGCFAKFCVVCEIFLCATFQNFLRRDFVTALYLVSFLPPSHFYTLPATPTTKYFYLEEVGAHLVWWHQRPFGAIVSNSASSSVLSVVATAVGEWLWVCRVFLAQMEGPSSFEVLDIKQWSSLNFQANFLVDLPFGCPLRQFKGKSSFPSICTCHFPTACLTFNFSSLLVVPHNPIESTHWKIKLQKMPNCVWVAELFQELSCLYKAISLPLIINRGHFFQTCRTASTTWLNVAMIRKV